MVFSRSRMPSARYFGGWLMGSASGVRMNLHSTVRSSEAITPIDTRSSRMGLGRLVYAI